MPCLDPLLTGWAGEPFCGVATGPGRHCPEMCDRALLAGDLSSSAQHSLDLTLARSGLLCDRSDHKGDTVTIKD